MRLTKGNVTIGIHTRFGPNWPGIRCLAKTRRGTRVPESRLQAQWPLCAPRGAINGRSDSGGLTAHLSG